MGIISRIPERVRARLIGPSLKHDGLKPWLRSSAALISFLATALFILPTFAATSPVGATAGQFKVSESGAANYSIGIATPPGTAGMQPSLSLSYNSQGGNGILGLGWNLSGLSLVQRCPKTLAQDGIKGGVNFDSNDRFCLDGQRLVAISGVYGADSTEYRTEIESYTKIVSYGTAGNGPASFKVWTKSGQIMEYGFTDDSRIEAQGKTSALLWALNKVTDTVGNYLTVTYTEDNANGQFYPNRIDYAGNTSAGLAPYNSVQFSYETRPDIAPDAYIAGSLIKNTMRLTNIKSFAGTALVREYRPAYDNTGLPNTSLLANLTECAGDGVCLPPTVFGWQRSTGGFQMQGATWAFPAGQAAASWMVNRTLPLADINGDGLGDCVYLSNGLVYAMLSNGTGFNTPTQWGSGYGIVASASNNGANLLGDINGDGKADFAYIQGGVVYVALSTGNSFAPASVWATGITIQANAWVSAWLADVDGDSKADLIYANGGAVNVLVSNGAGFAPASLWSSGNAYMKGVGADGLYSAGAVGDVDGDGRADFAYRQGDFINVRLSTGTSFGEAAGWGYISQGFLAGLADVDGDGRADQLYTYPAPNLGYNENIHVGFSDGKKFGTPVDFGAPYGRAIFAPNRVGDINGDGRADLVYASNTGIFPSINLTRTPTPTQLSTITNGLGTVTTITYKPLTDNTVYTKDNDAVYPIKDIQNQGPMYVVSSSSTSNGIGGNYALNYQYAGMKATQDGRGMLGFRSMDTTDPQTGIVTHNEYRQDYPYTGLPSLSTKKINGTLLNQAQNTYSANPLGGTRYAVQLTQSVESSYELNGSLVTTVTTTNQYDTYGNPTQIVVGTGDGYSKTTTNTYTNDSTNWLLGRLTLASVTSTMPVTGSLTRTSSFAYNATNGLLTQEVIEPNNVALRLQTDYTYDGYGNKLSVTVSGSDIITRTTSTIFDARGQFPTKTTNALNHSDTGTYDARFGKALTLTGPNALTTTWSYDGFGRKINETRADATQSNVAYNLCDATCPNFAKYYITSTTLGSPISYAYFDLLNREIRVQTQGFDGRLITKDTYYDSFGRVDRVTKPYYAGDSPLYSYLAYDGLGRPIQETAPDSSIKQIAYNGLSTTVTNALNQTETKTKNSQGQLVSVTDNLNNVISYQYDPFGNLTKTTDPKGNQTTLTYDARGRKIGMVDPDMGSWTYTYNVLGELIQQKDAKNQIVNMTYDKLGRMLTRSEPDLISTWVFDTASKVSASCLVLSPTMAITDPMLMTA